MRATVLALALLAPGVARAEPVEKVSGSVLVWNDAKLYVEPRDDAPTLQLGKDLATRDGHVGEAFAMRVVATKGDFVEVAQPANEQFDCTWARIDSTWFSDLHLFVKRADLAPVVGAAYAHSFEDLTRIGLSPGMPIVVGDDGRAALPLGPDRLVVALPDLHVAHSYPTPAKQPSYDQGKPAFELALHTKVSVGGTTFEVAPRLAGVYAPRVERKADAVLFPIGERCARVVVRAPASAVTAYQEQETSSDSGGGFGFGRALGSDRYFAAKGTKVVTSSGRPLGTTAQELDLPKPTGARTCVDWSLSLDQPYLIGPHTPPSEKTTTLSVCVRAADVRHEKMQGFGSGGGGSLSGKHK